MSLRSPEWPPQGRSPPGAGSGRSSAKVVAPRRTPRSLPVRCASQRPPLRARVTPCSVIAATWGVYPPPAPPCYLLPATWGPCAAPRRSGAPRRPSPPWGAPACRRRCRCRAARHDGLALVEGGPVLEVDRLALVHRVEDEVDGRLARLGGPPAEEELPQLGAGHLGRGAPRLGPHLLRLHAPQPLGHDPAPLGLALPFGDAPDVALGEVLLVRGPLGEGAPCASRTRCPAARRSGPG